jgi:VanZ family protein
VVLAGTSIPGAQVPDPVSRVDKSLHFLAYAVLGLLTCRALRATRTPIAAAALAALAAAAFGGVDEWHQSLVPGRYPELLDWLADAGGAVTGALAGMLAAPRRQPT